MLEARLEQLSQALTRFRADGLLHRVGGQDRAGAGQYFETRSPVDKSLICRVTRGTASDIDVAAEAASAAFLAWRDMPALKRVHLELGGRNPVVVFDDVDLVASKAFYTFIFGLQIKDESEMHLYLCALEERGHHSVILQKSDTPGTVEVMGYKVFAEADLDAAAAHFSTKRRSVEWVVRAHKGRTLRTSDVHGISNAFFLYIRDPDGHRIEIYASDYQTVDPDLEPIKWDLKDPQRQTLWGAPAPKSWFEEGSDFVGVPVEDATLNATPIVAP